VTIPVIETPRLTLRGHRLDDFAACAAMWGDANVAAYIGGQPLTTEAAWTKFLRYAGHWSMMGFGFWAIEERATGAYMGEVGFADFKRDIDPPFGDVAEAGWVLTTAAHGKGYATEAVRAALAWIDERPLASRTVCLIDPGNAASIRVAVKCGYRERRRVFYQRHRVAVFERDRSGTSGFSFRIRCATEQEVPSLRVLIDRSVRTLQAEDYSPDQIEAALVSVFGTDAQLIADGTFLVMEAVFPDGSRTIAGCGGWSKRKTLFGSDVAAGRNDDLLDPRVDAAKIRAFFIHPDWSRRGLGTMLLEACEDAALEAGFTSFEMGATLTGEKLFRARGYQMVERIEVPLGDRLSLPVIRMRKG
jgi:RimJ/RimL family protein N-acetyltransferase